MSRTVATPGYVILITIKHQLNAHKQSSDVYNVFPGP